MRAAFVWLMTALLGGLLLFLLVSVAGCHKAQNAASERAASVRRGHRHNQDHNRDRGSSGSKTGSNAPAGDCAGSADDERVWSVAADCG